MKELYITPIFDLILINGEDIITSSSPDIDEPITDKGIVDLPEFDF